ncbi:MAG: pyrroline-5-carboxylate reductase, partial [Gammaproteobacteria bacterium]|nr:pyrroline-5-carboxylate reductase [Gammaproteobacteria bacterium]
DVASTQKSAAEHILSAVGKALWVENESDLDAVTAVSGSGPAYFFLLMESMINAARAQGLNAEVSHQLVLQTALGAARMAAESPLDPATLRKQVTSPGGTTQAAIEHFQGKGFEKIVDGAVDAARIRSVELSDED